MKSLTSKQAKAWRAFNKVALNVVAIIVGAAVVFAVGRLAYNFTFVKTGSVGWARFAAVAAVFVLAALVSNDAAQQQKETGKKTGNKRAFAYKRHRVPNPENSFGAGETSNWNPPPPPTM